MVMVGSGGGGPRVVGVAGGGDGGGLRSVVGHGAAVVEGVAAEAASLSPGGFSVLRIRNEE